MNIITFPKIAHIIQYAILPIIPPPLFYLKFYSHSVTLVALVQLGAYSQSNNATLEPYDLLLPDGLDLDLLFEPDLLPPPLCPSITAKNVRTKIIVRCNFFILADLYNFINNMIYFCYSMIKYFYLNLINI